MSDDTPIKVIIKVEGGVADVVCATHDVEVTFVDYDADEYGFDNNDDRVHLIGPDNDAAFVSTHVVNATPKTLAAFEASMRPWVPVQDKEITICTHCGAAQLAHVTLHRETPTGVSSHSGQYCLNCRTFNPETAVVFVHKSFDENTQTYHGPEVKR